MSSTVMFDRSTMSAASGMSVPTSAMPGMPAMSPGMGNMCMVPRCTMKLEKCKGGMKITCTCDDEVACGMLQNLCKMLCQGMCNCCSMMNGIMICQCNLAMCHCKCEETADGVCITCTSGDKACCDMIQACCDCMCCCMEAGCTCCLSFNGTPCCCGTC